MTKNPLPLHNLDSLNHSYVVEGNTEHSFSQVLAFLKEYFSIVPGHADLFIFNSEDLGVGDVADIISANLRKPAFGQKKFILVNFSSISHQAQNSLLKTLEEPQRNTHIFLITQASAVLLPTVLSRVHVVTFGEPSADATGAGKKAVSASGFDAVILAKEFLASNQAERLDLIKGVLKQKEDEEISDSHIERWAGEIERLAHGKIKTHASKAASLAPFLVVDEYIRDSSSSTKLLLEYLALALPHRSMAP